MCFCLLILTECVIFKHYCRHFLKLKLEETLFADTQGTMPLVLWDSLKVILTKIPNYAILMDWGCLRIRIKNLLSVWRLYRNVPLWVCHHSTEASHSFLYHCVSIYVWVASESVKVLIKQYQVPFSTIYSLWTRFF